MKASKLIKRFVPVVGMLAMMAGSAAAQTIIWNFNEPGTPTTATDSSGNGNNGTVTGNVTSNGAGGYTGFTSATSQVAWNSTITDADKVDTTLAMWIKNPGNGGDSSHLTLAGIGQPGAGAGRGWELWLGAADLSGNRSLNLSWQAGDGSNGVVSSSTAFSFEANANYYLAFTWKTFAGFGFYPFDFSIYLGKDGDASLGSADFTGQAGNFGIAPPGGSETFYVGGNVDGFWSGSFPAGYVGGDIGSVKLWLNQPTLDAAALNADFLATSTIPEPSAVVLLVSGIAVFVFLRKFGSQFNKKSC